MFDNRLLLLVESLQQAVHRQVPTFATIESKSADCTAIKPAEYRADRLFLLLSERGEPVLGSGLETQLSSDEDKRFTWPVYSTEPRARFRCPILVIVVTPYDSVEHWCRKPIDLGGGNTFVPTVIGPSLIPKITEVADAARSPELAVMSVIAHSQKPEVEAIAKVALQAVNTLDKET